MNDEEEEEDFDEEDDDEEDEDDGDLKEHEYDFVQVSVSPKHIHFVTDASLSSWSDAETVWEKTTCLGWVNYSSDIKNSLIGYLVVRQNSI